VEKMGPYLSERQWGMILVMRQKRRSVIVNALVVTWTNMYGPPSDCKEKLEARRQVCANVFGLW
jgi:hypothetical protein